MKKLRYFQVDSFASQTFKGNPAGVCILDEWISETEMQLIGEENNLSETAFVGPGKNGYKIRWFTPLMEVKLCGHATLAAGYVLFNYYGYQKEKVNFETEYRGIISVEKGDNLFTLNFPEDELIECEVPQSFVDGLGVKPLKCFKGKTDYLLIYKSESVIQSMSPNYETISTIDCRGVIVSAPGDNVDFVSRFFAPQAGVNEDPVTGSAHTSLTPYWANQFGKSKLSAKQISRRGGDLICEMKEDRVLISGNAVTFLEGYLYV